MGHGGSERSNAGMSSVSSTPRHIHIDWSIVVLGLLMIWWGSAFPNHRAVNRTTIRQRCRNTSARTARPGRPEAAFPAECSPFTHECGFSGLRTCSPSRRVFRPVTDCLFGHRVVICLRASLAWPTTVKILWLDRVCPTGIQNCRAGYGMQSWAVREPYRPLPHVCFISVLAAGRLDCAS